MLSRKHDVDVATLFPLKRNMEEAENLFLEQTENLFAKETKNMSPEDTDHTSECNKFTNISIQGINVM